METFALTDIGRERDRNEDRYLIKELPDGSMLLAVADGMGGEAAGDYAAETMINCLFDIKIKHEDAERQLSDQIKEADLILSNEAEINPDFRGMGTTVTVACIKDCSVRWAHVGDSRLYLLHDRKLARITKDQNMAQFLVDEGEITEEEARFHPFSNLLEQCVGCGDCKTITGHFEINSGDQIIITSDGLHGSLSAETIFSMMDEETGIEDKVRTLVHAALDAGGQDNITIVVALI